MELSVVLVTYHADEFIVGCLDSLMKDISWLTHEVFVIDNSQNDVTAMLVRQHYPDVQLIKTNENIGFAAANNIAIHKSKGDYILVLNPDTLVKPHSIKTLIGFMNEHSDAGLVAGRLVTEDNSVQYSIRNFPTMLNQLGECFYLYRLPLTGGLLSEMLRDTNGYWEERSVDWVSGAQLLVRRAVVEQVGLFDERFFLYSEEQDWCYRIKAAGWQIYFTPHAQFVHYEGESSTNANLYSQLLLSKMLFFKKHYSPLKVALLTRILFLNVMIRFLGWNALYLINPTKRDKARRKALMYGFGLSAIASHDIETSASEIKARIIRNT